MGQKREQLYKDILDQITTRDYFFKGYPHRTLEWIDPKGNQTEGCIGTKRPNGTYIIRVSKKDEYGDTVYDKSGKHIQRISLRVDHLAFFISFGHLPKPGHNVMFFRNYTPQPNYHPNNMLLHAKKYQGIIYRDNQYLVLKTARSFPTQIEAIEHLTHQLRMNNPLYDWNSSGVTKEALVTRPPELYLLGNEFASQTITPTKPRTQIPGYYYALDPENFSRHIIVKLDANYRVTMIGDSKTYPKDQFTLIKRIASRP